MFSCTNISAGNLANITCFHTRLIFTFHPFYKYLSSFSKAQCWALGECNGEQKLTRTLPYKPQGLMGMGKLAQKVLAQANVKL